MSNKDNNLLSLLLNVENKNAHTKKEIIQALKKINWVYQCDEYSIIKDNPSLLVFSLTENFEESLKEIEKMTPNQTLSFNNEERIKVINMLRKKSFSLNKKNLHLIYVSPVFLIASLANNYKKTMQLLKENVNSYIEMDDDYSKMLYGILAHNDFSYEDAGEWLYYNRYAFRASLDNDYSKTVYSLKYNKDLPVEVKNMFLGELKRQEPPVTYMPQAMVEDPYVLSRFVDEKLVKFAIEKIFPGNCMYTEQDEKELLSLIGADSYKSVEKYISHLYIQGKDRFDLSFEELFAINFYLKKYIQEEGANDCKIYMFPHGGFFSNATGSYHEEENFIVFHINPEEPETIDRILNILLHEATHCVQYFNMQHKLFHKDPDIDVYQKDRLLKYICNGYYLENYYSLSYEFDAETKSNILTSLILGLDTNNYLDTFSFSAGHHKTNNEYRLTNTRKYDDEPFDLHMIIDLHIRSYLKETDFKEGIEYIRENYPFFDYEYVVEGHKVRRKTIEEIVEDYRGTYDETYLYLLTQRLVKYKDVEYSRNAEKLMELVVDEDNPDIENELVNCYSKAQELNKDKFNKYRAIIDNKGKRCIR